MAENIQTQGLLDLPRDGWRKALFRSPLLAWRMGMDWMLPPTFVLLATFGRKSGQSRATFVEHGIIEDKLYIASGWGKQPQWVQNLLANPAASLQIVRHAPMKGRLIQMNDEGSFRHYYQAMAGKTPVWKAWLDKLGVEDNEDAFVASRERVVIFRFEADESIEAPAIPQHDLWWLSGLLLLGIISAAIGGFWRR